MAVVYNNTISQPPPRAYQDELERERVRALDMTQEQLRADLASSGSSVARHNACLARLASLQTRLPEGPREHHHAHEYSPWEREFGRDE